MLLINNNNSEIVRGFSDLIIDILVPSDGQRFSCPNVT